MGRQVDFLFQPSTWIPLVTAFVALSGVALGSYLNAHYTFKNQLYVTNYQTRQQSYSAIMGKKFLRTQLYMSRFEASIYSDYHETLWHHAGNPPVSMDLDEARRWMHKSEDLAVEIARTNESLFESIGRVRASFPATDELDTLTERVYHFGTPNVKPPPAESNRAALEAWKVQAVADLQKLVEREYAEPIDSLLQYLKPHMNDPVSY